MNTSLQTFNDIFNFEYNEEKIKVTKIIIPIIQRDYAQGRPEEIKVRNRFLDSLHKAITEKPITLDFIYGDIDQEGIMTPLDGQQRLTTLFLLYWYAAKHENIDEREYSFLKNFGYDTRYSAREFCKELIGFMPSFSQKISKEIADQSWFLLDWESDPTIFSMLTMLDAIDMKFSNIKGIWNKLCDKSITFYFLPIKDMGLTDEIYIKMNSRGKMLTQFEHVKAELEHSLREIDSKIADRIIRKIDTDWTYILWQYRGKDNVIDNEFLRYFQFICDIICYKQNNSPQGNSRDEFFLISKYFSKNSENVFENIKLLETYFDCWCELRCKPKEFFNRYFSIRNHQTNKILTNWKNIDIFEECLKNYVDVLKNKNRQFPLNQIIMLYAIIIYLLNNDVVSEEKFIRRIRVINNLVLNSADEISDNEYRTGGNRMPAILKQVEKIIIEGIIDDSITKAFNTNQIIEEKEKFVWVSKNPALAEKLFVLEDNSLLYGQISILGLENIDLFEKFSLLFNCDKDLVDCALLATGTYYQIDKNKWRYQLGSKWIETAWKNLFHKSSLDGFDKTKTVIVKLLTSLDEITNDSLRKVKNEYIAVCENKNEYDWRYYYIKYSNFRPGKYGKYSWLNVSREPYSFYVMWTDTHLSQNTYQPFLYEIDAKHISRDDFGKFLVYDDKKVICENDAFVVRNNEKELARIEILQNENGIDIEDRIIKGKRELPIILKAL